MLFADLSRIYVLSLHVILLQKPSGTVASPVPTLTASAATISTPSPKPTTTSAASKCTPALDPSCWWATTQGICAIVGTVVATILAAVGVYFAVKTYQKQNEEIRHRREKEEKEARERREKEVKEANKRKGQPWRRDFWRKFWRKDTAKSRSKHMEV